MGDGAACTPVAKDRSERHKTARAPSWAHKTTCGPTLISLDHQPLPLLSSGFPVHLIRSSSNDHSEAPKGLSVGRVARFEGVSLPIGYARTRVDVSALQVGVAPGIAPTLVNMQYDEGDELCRKAIPDPVPTTGPVARFFVFCEGRRRGQGRRWVE